VKSTLSSTSDVGVGCDCLPRCLDIATGVLMHRDGLTPQEARARVLRLAERENISIHAASDRVIEAAVHGHS
jgi:AmiR/NasT family two-component response regulator